MREIIKFLPTGKNVYYFFYGWHSRSKALIIIHATHKYYCACVLRML